MAQGARRTGEGERAEGRGKDRGQYAYRKSLAGSAQSFSPPFSACSEYEEPAVTAASALKKDLGALAPRTVEPHSEAAMARTEALSLMQEAARLAE